MKTYISILSLLFVFQSVASESSEDFWLGFFAKRKITKELSLWAETQMRYNIEASSNEQTLFRTGLLNKIGKNQEVGFLYAFVQGGANKEHRLALQHTMKYKDDSFSLGHRVRLEYRTLEDSNPAPERFRYLIRYQSKDIYKAGSLVSWNESFLNFTKTPNNDGIYERNRLFIGMRKKVSDEVTLEYGYLNQYVPRDSEDQIDHTLVLYLFL